MDSQLLFDIIVGSAGALAGMLLNKLWDAVTDLQQADSRLADKVASIEILVAGEYVKRSDFQQLSDALFKKLDKIEDKIDSKADKR